MYIFVIWYDKKGCAPFTNTNVIKAVIRQMELLFSRTFHKRICCQFSLTETLLNTVFLWLYLWPWPLLFSYYLGDDILHMFVLIHCILSCSCYWSNEYEDPATTTEPAGISDGWDHQGLVLPQDTNCNPPPMWFLIRKLKIGSWCSDAGLFHH